MNILFITWDGPESSYLEGLFLPIFSELKSSGINFHVLQFTWDDKERYEDRRKACKFYGCSYERVSVIRKPIVSIGSLLTAILAHKHILKAITKYKIDIVMPRSYLPALSTLLAIKYKNMPIVFDADGLPIDERVEFSSLSTNSLSYRVLKDIETQIVLRSNKVLTRSPIASDILRVRAGLGLENNKFISFNNSRNSELFSIKSDKSNSLIKEELGLSDNFKLITYVGSLGGKYSLEKMLDLFNKIHQKLQNTHLLILTPSITIAENILYKKNFNLSNVTLMSADSNQVSKYISASDLGLSLIKPSFSMQAVSAIKIGEYLLCGVPVISTSNIGNSSEVCAQAGFVLENMSDHSLDQAARWFVESVVPNRDYYRKLSRDVGLSYYSMQQAVSAYKKAILD